MNNSVAVEASEIRPRFRRTVQVVGAGLIAIGVFAASLGPIEVKTFYSYSLGGRFYYEGFGFGSLGFALIAIQVIGYYLVAVPLIPLGYGQLMLRPWARKLTLALLWDWLVVGLPLTVISFLLLIMAKEPPESSIPFFVLLFFLMYPIVPILLILFYRSVTARIIFQQDGFEANWVARTPQPILVLGGLMVFFTIAQHVPLLFDGMFLFFGVFLSGWRGFLLTDLSIMLLIFLAWGILRRRKWAWWGSSAYFMLMSSSYTVSFIARTPRDILTQMKLAGWETALRDVPINGVPLVLFVLLFMLPMYVTLMVVAKSWCYFGDSKSGNVLLGDVLVLLMILLTWAFLWRALV